MSGDVSYLMQHKYTSYANANVQHCTAQGNSIQLNIITAEQDTSFLHSMAAMNWVVCAPC